MSKNIVGDYVASITDVALITVGKEKEYPVIELSFELESKLVGPTWEDCEHSAIRKLFFLSLDPVRSGKNVGKTGIEVTKTNLVEAFDYDGGLDENDLKGKLIGKKARIVCGIREDGGKTYSEVKYVNKYGGVAKERARKPISPEVLAALDAKFSGNKPMADAASAWSGAKI